MRHPARVLVLLTIVLALPPALAHSLWQQSGWIGTCAGIGCTGRQTICAIYTYTSSSGDQVKNYCYRDL